MWDYRFKRTETFPRPQPVKVMALTLLFPSCPTRSLLRAKAPSPFLTSAGRNSPACAPFTPAGQTMMVLLLPARGDAVFNKTKCSTALAPNPPSLSCPPPQHPERSHPNKVTLCLDTFWFDLVWWGVNFKVKSGCTQVTLSLLLKDCSWQLCQV